MPIYMTFRAFQRVEANTHDRFEGFRGPPVNKSFRSNNINVLTVISGVTHVPHTQCTHNQLP